MLTLAVSIQVYILSMSAASESSIFRHFNAACPYMRKQTLTIW